LVRGTVADQAAVAAEPSVRSTVARALGVLAVFSAGHVELTLPRSPGAPTCR
jgi:hypothetical protein